jgi:beta-glucanase (GH16 family)
MLNIPTKTEHRGLGRRLLYAVSIAVLTLIPKTASAQNWQLVWQDEFNGSIGPDWSFETGRGSGGWGNNELEYYLPQNATIENNTLAITAKNESVGGASYTSARMSTQGHKSWKYGKIVASIHMPSFTGQWPAFWMLGDNIGSVGWPACGELDIMEQINTDSTVHGSTHWYSGGQADWTSSATTSITGWHEYSVTWDPQYIKWFIDGAQYSQFYIGGNSGGTNAFNNNNFFIILNMAVGGNWPGFSVNNGALPAKMNVDWIRVYQDAGGGINSGGTYSMMARHDGLYLDAFYALTANGTLLAQGAWNGGNNQKWIANNVGGSQYTLIGVQSGRAVDVPGATSADVQLQLYDSNGTGAQKWTITPTDSGYNRLINVSSGKAMDVYGLSTAQGGPVYQSAWNGGGNQQWFFQPR